MLCQACYACCASAGGTYAVLCMPCCACCAVHAVLWMLCSLIMTGKTHLHLGVACLEQRRKQHEVIILAPNYFPLLIIIKNGLQKLHVMQKSLGTCPTACMFCGTEQSTAAAYVAVTSKRTNIWYVFHALSFIFTISFHAYNTLADFCCKTCELCSTGICLSSLPSDFMQNTPL